MKCITCETEMKCVNDVNDISTRIDWLDCPKCGSTAEITYGTNGAERQLIKKVIWNR